MVTISKIQNNIGILGKLKDTVKYPIVGNKVGKNMDNVANLINRERLIDTFTKLAAIDSGSDEQYAEVRIPSTECQKNIAHYLKDELFNMGFFDANVDENFVVTATLNHNTDESGKIIGLLAHYDTSDGAPNSNVRPQIHDYKTGDINLKGGTKISSEDLKPYQNQQIITSDGTTLLGADDKAGIAEILETLRVLIEHPEIKHPTVRIAFTPDEETGMGISKFDIKSFGADFAYTIDGDVPDAIENESFNAFNPEIKIKGVNVHSGYAKGKMINSIDVANWIINKLPKKEKPQNTDKKRGYYHVSGIFGDVGETKINMLVRDHDFGKAKKRVEYLKKIVKRAEEKFGCKITIDEKERYHNMKEFIDKNPEVIKCAKEGLKLSGLKPKTKSIRGGTDGSQLSQKGLPTPNLGAGGLNFHSKNEFLPVSNLLKCCENIINILQVWAKNISEK